jgi:hypothetical protein
MFKDTRAFCKTCENYQKLGSISKRHMMPLKPIQRRRLQKIYNVDFIGQPCLRTCMHSAKLVKIVKS